MTCWVARYHVSFTAGPHVPRSAAHVPVNKAAELAVPGGVVADGVSAKIPSTVRAEGVHYSRHSFTTAGSHPSMLSSCCPAKWDDFCLVAHPAPSLSAPGPPAFVVAESVAEPSYRDSSVVMADIPWSDAAVAPFGHHAVGRCFLCLCWCIVHSPGSSGSAGTAATIGRALHCYGEGAKSRTELVLPSRGAHVVGSPVVPRRGSGVR